MVLIKSKSQKRKAKSSGLTLVELLVAMAIFSIVISVAILFFTTAMKSQRKILAQQQLLDQTGYALEYMSRAIRMAKKDDFTGSCTGTANLNYVLTRFGQGIKFKNYNGVCQEFYLESGQLKETKVGLYSGLPLTSWPGFTVTSFLIKPSGETQSDVLQSAVTMFLDIVEKQNQAKIQIQTTISQRNLDVRY